MVITKRVLSLLVMLTSAFGMVSCDSTPSGTNFASVGNHSVVLVSGSGQSALRGQALPNPIIAKVVDASGNPVPNQYVLAAVTSGGGTVNIPIPMSDVNGDVVILWTLGTSLNADLLSISVSNSSGQWDNSASVSVTASRIGSPASIANSSIVGTGPIVANGVTTSHITVTLLDSNHEPLTGIIPTFSATGTNNYFPCSPVNTSGISTCTMSSSTLGLKTLSLTSPIAFSSGNVTFISGTPSLLTAAGNSNNVLSVLLKDAYSNIVTAQQIDWTVTAGGGTLTGASSNTDLTGTASNIYTSASSGVQTITAAVHGYPQVLPVTFTLDFGTWTFLSGTTSSYILGNNIDFSVGNVCELTPSNAPDNSAASYAAGTASGVTYGTLSDGVSTGFKLGYDGTTCNGTTTDCAPKPEMSAAWTPEWSHLLAYWKLNNTWSDVLGTSNLTPMGSATFTSQTNFGTGAGSFNGSGMATTTTNFNPQNYDAGFTMMGWIFGYGEMFSFLDTGWSGIELGLFNISGTYETNIRFGGGVSGQTCSYQIHLPSAPSGWTHIAAVHSGTTDQTFLNGVLFDTETCTHLGNNSTTLFVGAEYTNYNDATVGSLDELAIFGTSLTPDEIQTIYARQSGTHTGVFTSRVMDAKQPSSWTSLSWLPTLPFGKALPDNAVNETIANYPNLTNSTLMTGIAGLWHLDETTGTTVADSSGSGKSGVLNGGVTLGSTGKIVNSASFNGTNGYAALPVLTTQTTNVSMSAWFRSNNYKQPRQIIFYNGSDANGNGYGLALNKEGETSGLVRVLYGGVVWFSTNTYVTNSNWHHLLLVIAPDGHPIVYLDGALIFIGTSYAINVPTVEADIGRDNYSGFVSYFNGSLDEVGIWNRSLSATEVQQLYQRGASRVKFQVQSCTQANCSDGTWQGPDGTSTSYYSEFDNTSTYNQATNSPSGTVNAGLPSMTFANFATPTPAPNRYFQYRAILESDSASTTLMPEVKSIAIGPNHYDPSSPSIVGKIGVTVPILSAFTQTLGANGCASATYNLGIGSSVASAIWYYWTGSAWSVAGGATATSSAATAISANLSSFPVIGSDTVYFKAFLNSNGSTPCELSAVQLNGHN
jgi:hypothetical protein